MAWKFKYKGKERIAFNSNDVPYNVKVEKVNGNKYKNLKSSKSYGFIIK